MITSVVKNNTIQYQNDFPSIDFEPQDLLTNGSLIFLDAKNVNNATNFGDFNVENLAFNNALQLIPNGNNNTLNLILTGNPGGNVLTELTSKNGFHGIYTGTNGSGERKFEPQSDLKTYLNNNANHDFFMSLSHRITRPIGESGTSTNATYSGLTKKDYACLWAFDAIQDLPPNGNALRKNFEKVGNDTSVNLVYRSMQVGGGVYTTWIPFADGFEHFPIWKVGDNSNWEVDKSKRRPCHILYQFYLEDLTVSGRTFEEVNNIMKTRHNKIHSEGGKYFGDTWTNP